MNAIASLQEKPRRCSLATENEVFSEEVRQLLYGKSRNRYRVLFTIREDIVYSVSRTHEVHLPPALCLLPPASKPKTLYLTSMRTAIYPFCPSYFSSFTY